jgi:uncharacterized glyoxalase superfamily protein PhnB
MPIAAQVWGDYYGSFKDKFWGAVDGELHLSERELKERNIQ